MFQTLPSVSIFLVVKQKQRIDEIGKGIEEYTILPPHLSASTDANNCEKEGAAYYYPLNKCYWLNTEITDAADGQAYCELTNNGHLADLVDMQNQEFITLHVIPSEFSEQSSVWLGIHNNRTLGSWTSFNGDNLTWTNWNDAYSQPDNDGDCAYMSFRYGWEWFDLMCSRRSHSPYALCEADGIGEDTTVNDDSLSTTVTSSTIETTTSKTTTTTTTTAKPATTSSPPSPIKTTILETTTLNEITTQTVSVPPYTLCKCYRDNTTLQVTIEKMKKEMQVEKRKTTRYRKKFECANDKRVSSKAIGSLGLVLCIIAFSLPVVLDLLSCIGCYSKPVRSRVRKPLIPLNLQE